MPRYELLGCALNGHSIVGEDVRTVRPEDGDLLREHGGFRWHRCLRCDAWVPAKQPESPVRDTLPPREEIEVPIRGKLLRDRYVLRLIALDRALHFVVLGALAVAVGIFAVKRQGLHDEYFRFMDQLQTAMGGRSRILTHGLGHDLTKAFDMKTQTLWIICGVVLAYAILEGVEAVGLWYAKRWAEYLTFIATSVLLIPELYELQEGVKPLKVVTLVINLAVVGYLLWAKRLFGLNGGGAREAEERIRDSGWGAVDRALPGRQFDTSG